MDDLQFYIFLTVFQSYQDNGWLIKGWLQWNPVYGRKDFASSRAGTQDRSALNPLSYRGSWYVKAPVKIIYWDKQFNSFPYVPTKLYIVESH